jgi:5-hydroxyisourate hydrolase-like protein (transthyretin family)/outer membrane biosynthesis protein TonB
MKKIILAPAVALAFTGLVASPVAAAESPSTQSSDSAEAKAKKAEAEKAEKEKAEAEKKAEEKAAAEKEAAEKAAKEKAEKEKAEAEKKAADKAAKEKAAKEKAAEDKAAEDKASDEKKDEKAKTPKKVDPKPAPSPKDGDEGDEVEELNASLKLSTQSIKAEDLAEEGLKVTVTGLEKGDKVSVNGGDLTAGTTTASGSSATLTLNTNEDAEDIATKQSVSLQVERTGVAPQSLTDTVSVQSSEDDSIDASLTVDPEEITAEDLADKDKGVEVTVSGVEKGDKVTDSLTDNEKSVASDGDFTFGVYYKGNAEDLEEGPVPFEVTIDREGTESETLKGTIDVVDDTEVDPSVKLESKKITLEDFKKDGLEFTGSGFSPDGTVSVQGEAVSTQRAAAPQADELRADEDGNVEGAVVAPESLEAGKYALTFIDDETGEKTDAVEVTVTEDEDAVDPIDASLTVDPEEITAEDLADKDKGVEVTVSGVKKGDRIKDSLTGKTETAEADGDHVLHLWWDGNPDSLEVGKVPFSVTIDREGTESETLKGNINVVGEDDGDDGETEAPAEATFEVSPKTIEAADFANEDKGVTLAVENCEPGQDVHFEVNPKGINVTAYENTVKADDEGRASVNVFGTSSDASAYVGSYTATATCGDDTMKDSFKVTEGADSGGDSGNGGDNGNAGNGDGSQLPRTGADLGGLTTGALLLLVGGAAIAITGRKNKFGQNPTSF